jgi:hypothetical protein
MIVFLTSSKVKLFKDLRAYLVKLQNVQKLEQLPVLLRVLELDVVLLEAVQGQLGLVVDVDFHRLQEKMSGIVRLAELYGL